MKKYYMQCVPFRAVMKGLIVRLTLQASSEGTSEEPLYVTATAPVETPALL